MNMSKEDSIGKRACRNSTIYFQGELCESHLLIRFLFMLVTLNFPRGIGYSKAQDVAEYKAQ